MTRVVNALVLDGDTIRARLLSERTHSQTHVHIDWLRFTVQRRLAPTPSVDNLFPLYELTTSPEDFKSQRLHRLLLEIPDCDQHVSKQAWELAERVSAILGPEFAPLQTILKGHDFYRFRWSIQRAGVEVGWVGFMSSSSSPRQQAQGRTIHVNLYGTACTFAQHGWTHQMASLCDELNADITRTDLALDFFDGLPGGFESIVADYKAGLCDVGGKRPKCNQVGDWINGHERSFYLGSKEAGKQTNVYEKGDQLYGSEAGSLWHRIELRYGNKLRVIPSDVLRRPADFFAGASEWHKLMLAQAEPLQSPEPIKTTARLCDESVQAEVTRNLRWAFNTAAPTIAAAWKHMGDRFLDLVTGTTLPGRLQRFTEHELSSAFAVVAERFTPSGGYTPPAFQTA